MGNGRRNPTSKHAAVLLLCLLWPSSTQASLSPSNDANSLNMAENSIHDLPENNDNRSFCNTSTTFRIPSSCMDVVLTSGHFHYDANREQLRINLGSHDLGTVTGYRFASLSNQTIHFCFPLTPQLLNCNLRQFQPHCYQLKHHKLTISGSNFSAELGDYYIDSDRNAFACPETILPGKHRPRCNKVQLATGQYAINPDGSIHIRATNHTIRHPQYHIDEDDKISVCYPLSIAFLNCHVTSAMLLHTYLYDKMSELRIFFRSFTRMYNVDEYYSKNNNDADFIVCAPENPKVAIILRYIYNTCKGVSIILVSLTISHHLMAPKLTVHAKCLLSYYISGIAFFILTMIPVMECYTSFVTIYLASNAAVVWVSIASYDIWKSFTRMGSSPNHYLVKKKSDPYTYYCILGWGAPVVLLTFTLILDKYYSTRNVLFLSPLVGLNENCWYHDKWISFGLHYGFNLILSLVNTIFFLLTVYSIHKGSNGTELVNKHRKKQMYIVRFKLFIIMGCVLVMEGVTWCIQEHFNFQFWYIADAFISVQGMTIFFAETCKRDAFRLMANRFRLNFGKLGRKWNLSFIRSTVYTATSQEPPSSDTARKQQAI